MFKQVLDARSRKRRYGMGSRAIARLDGDVVTRGLHMLFADALVSQLVTETDIAFLNSALLLVAEHSDLLVLQLRM